MQDIQPDHAAGSDGSILHQLEIGEEREGVVASLFCVSVEEQRHRVGCFTVTQTVLLGLHGRIVLQS